MKEKLFIIDTSDKRNEYLLEFLKDDGFDVQDFNDFSLSFLNQNHYKNIIYIFPPSKTLDSFMQEKIAKNSTIFGYKMKGDTPYFSHNNIHFINIMDDKTYTTINSDITSEGALKYVIENTDFAIFEQSILILGYGYLGKSLLKTFKPLAKKTAIMLRNKKESEIAKLFTPYVYSFNDISQLKEFDVIINTVPSMVLDKDKFFYLKKNVFLLELASAPFGINESLAKEMGMNYLKVLGVPSKVACETASKVLKNRILTALSIDY